MKPGFHRVMQDSYDFDHLVIRDAVKENVSRILHQPLRARGTLSGVSEVKTSKAGGDFITHAAADPTWRSRYVLHRCLQQCLITEPRFSTKLHLGMSQNIRDV